MIKVIGRIREFDVDISGLLNVYIDIMAEKNQHLNVPVPTKIDSAMTATVMNQQLLDFVQAYAVANMGVVFDIGDVSRLLGGIDLI
jgi:hypothetical protein